MLLKLEKIDRSRTVTFTDKKTGKPKTLPKIGVCSGGKWYGAFQGPWNASWVEGQEVEVEVTETKSKDGKSFFNIAPISEETKALEAINAKLDKILKFMEIAYSEGQRPTTKTSSEDVPF